MGCNGLPHEVVRTKFIDLHLWWKQVLWEMVNVIHVWPQYWNFRLDNFIVYLHWRFRIFVKPRQDTFCQILSAWYLSLLGSIWPLSCKRGLVKAVSPTFFINPFEIVIVCTLDVINGLQFLLILYHLLCLFFKLFERHFVADLLSIVTRGWSLAAQKISEMRRRHA